MTDGREDSPEPLVNEAHLEVARLLYLERLTELHLSGLKGLHAHFNEPRETTGLHPHDLMSFMADSAGWDAEVAAIWVAERLAERADPFSPEIAEAFREYAAYARGRYSGPGNP